MLIVDKGATICVPARTLEHMREGGEDRWERLFGELAGREEPAWDEYEVADLVRAEQVGIRLVERLVGALGQRVSVQTITGGIVSGRLTGLADAWLVLEESAADHLVVIDGVASIGPLGAPRPGSRAIPLGVPLRRIAQRGAAVVLDCHGQIRGTLRAVGADHVEVLTEGGQAIAVALAALVSIRCAPGTFSHED